MRLTKRFFIRFLFLFTLCTAGLFTLASAAQTNQLIGVRSWPSPDNTRIVLDLARKPDFKVHYLKHPDRLLVDLKSTVNKVDLKEIKNNGPLVKNLRESASGQKDIFRLVLDLNQASKASVFALLPEKPYGHRLVLDLPHQQAPKVSSAAQKTTVLPAAGRDIIIAVDAGHGGDDPGALGRYSYEKKVTLEIAKRLQKRINQQKGMRAFLIRKGDYFVNLNKRSAIAREQKADFLVSIHADGFTSSRPYGASVWVLSNRRATTELGRWMERHEAHSELLGGAGDLISDSSSVPFLTEMFLDMSMGNAMDVGYNVGDLVVNELKHVTKLHKKKPVHASLAVLKSPDIPSILVEAGFITNRREEKLLNSSSHQNKIANAVFKGIYKHFTEAPPQDTLFAQKKRAIKHTVRSGESLSVLAARYSVSVNKLKSYNQLNSNSLRIGQVIKIPSNYQLVVKQDPVTTIAAQPQQEQIHKVQRGEALSLIAQRYGKTTKELKDYNNLRSTSLAIGQRIKIPGEYVLPAEQPKAEFAASKAAQATVHKVTRGESLSLIAQRYGKTTKELKEYNNLRSTSLAIGQRINIPGENVTVAPLPEAVPSVVKPAQELVHQVKQGESLSLIAQRYGKTIHELKRYNKLRSASLLVGQKIKIPGTAAGSAVQVASVKPLIHKVSRGESLSVIAQRYGKTTSELKTYNKLSSTSLAVGQKLKIPGENVTVAQLPKAEPSVVKPDQALVHKVKRGESLSVVAQRYGKTTSELKTHNKLSSTSLAVGQKLKIPGENVTAAQLPKAEPSVVTLDQALVHKVKRGESLSLIAQRYGKTTNELKRYNKLRSTSLLVGQKIKIPGTAADAIVQVASVKPYIHKVSRGESLSVIAQRYGKTTNELKAYNKLTSTSLLIGQKIKIPVAADSAQGGLVKVSFIVHKVTNGESLSVIASRYRTTVKELKKHNKLSSSSLLIGQKIKIPISADEFTKHKVRSGESLSVIANRYGTTTEALKAFNKLPSSSLLIGQVLTIPVT